MLTYDDPEVAELEAQMEQLHAECNAAQTRKNRLILSIDARLLEQQERIRNGEKLTDERKAIELAPRYYFAAQNLPQIELKLKVAVYELKRKTNECKCLEAKHMDVFKNELRVKKENKQLTKTVETLTTQLEGKALPRDQQLKAESQDLEKELAELNAQLKNKTEECEQKDNVIIALTQDIEDLRDDFGAYQSVISDTWAHRHDSCNELNEALDEQCMTLTAERDILEANLDTLHHKINALAMERDDLQGNLDDAIKAHKIELEDLDSIKCEGSSGCTSCVMHLKRALQISRCAESQALNLVDRIDHDRMVAWNQLHEHQTRLVQEHYASVGAWVAARQTPSPSPTLVSPTFKSGESGNDGWKITGTCNSPEGGSVDFIL